MWVTIQSQSSAIHLVTLVVCLMPLPGWLGLEHNTCMAHGCMMARLGDTPFVSPLKKIGYVSCFCVECSEVWDATNIVYCPVVHYDQVAILDLEKFYPILPSKPLSLICCYHLLVEIVYCLLLSFPVLRWQVLLHFSFIILYTCQLSSFIQLYFYFR